MPVREIVTEELFKSQLKYFKENTYKDFKENIRNSTISLLIIHLYEMVIVSYTLKFSNGVANYRFVSQNLPNEKNSNELVVFRDKLTHNFYKIKSFKDELKNFLINFGKDNFDDIIKKLEIEDDIYSVLLKYSNE